MRIASCIVLASIAGVAGGQNLLNNAGFEQSLGFDFADVSNWNGFFGGPAGTFLEAFNDTGAPAFSGAQALEVTIEGEPGVTNGEGAFTGHVQQVDGIIAGDEYELSVFARNNDSGLTGSVEWRVEWFDANGEVGREEILLQDVLTDEYQQFSFNPIAAAGATTARIVIAIASGDDDGNVNDLSVLFDDASFVRIPAPATAGVFAAAGLIARRRRA